MHNIDVLFIFSSLNGRSSHANVAILIILNSTLYQKMMFPIQLQSAYKKRKKTKQYNLRIKLLIYVQNVCCNETSAYPTVIII